MFVCLFIFWMLLLWCFIEFNRLFKNVKTRINQIIITRIICTLFCILIFCLIKIKFYLLPYQHEKEQLSQVLMLYTIIVSYRVKLMIRIGYSLILKDINKLWLYCWNVKINHLKNSMTVNLYQSLVVIGNHGENPSII